MAKGVGPVSKRLSRAFRPSALFINTVESAIRVKYVRRGMVRMLARMVRVGWRART